MLSDGEQSLSRRRFLAASSLVGAQLALAPPGRAATRRERAQQLSVRIGGTSHGRTDVLEWEARRVQVVARRLAGNLPAAIVHDLEANVVRPDASVATVARDRRILAATKLLAGEDARRELTASDLALSGPASELAAQPHRFVASVTDISSSRGSARGFARWFADALARNDERAMLVACPDHYLIRTPGSQRQEVIEVTGGAPAASRFVIDYTDTDGVPIAPDPAFRVQLAGNARTDDGTTIGAVRHQFASRRRGGFHGRLAVAFPASLPQAWIDEHRWHLACEFSNWITAYIGSTNA